MSESSDEEAEHVHFVDVADEPCEDDEVPSDGLLAAVVLPSGYQKVAPGLRRYDAGIDGHHAVGFLKPLSSLADMHAVAVDLFDDRDVPVPAVGRP